MYLAGNLHSTKANLSGQRSQIKGMRETVNSLLAEAKASYINLVS